MSRHSKRDRCDECGHKARVKDVEGVCPRCKRRRERGEGRRREGRGEAC